MKICRIHGFSDIFWSSVKPSVPVQAHPWWLYGWSYSLSTFCMIVSNLICLYRSQGATVVTVEWVPTDVCLWPKARYSLNCSFRYHVWVVLFRTLKQERAEWSMWRRRHVTQEMNCALTWYQVPVCFLHFFPAQHITRIVIFSASLSAEHNNGASSLFPCHSS